MEARTIQYLLKFEVLLEAGKEWATRKHHNAICENLKKQLRDGNIIAENGAVSQDGHRSLLDAERILRAHYGYTNGKESLKKAIFTLESYNKAAAEHFSTCATDFKESVCVAYGSDWKNRIYTFDQSLSRLENLDNMISLLAEKNVVNECSIVGARWAFYHAHVGHWLEHTPDLGMEHKDQKIEDVVAPDNLERLFNSYNQGIFRDAV